MLQKKHSQIVIIEESSSCKYAGKFARLGNKKLQISEITAVL